VPHDGNTTCNGGAWPSLNMKHAALAPGWGKCQCCRARYRCDDHRPPLPRLLQRLTFSSHPHPPPAPPPSLSLSPHALFASFAYHDWHQHCTLSVSLRAQRNYHGKQLDDTKYNRPRRHSNRCTRPGRRPTTADQSPTQDIDGMTSTSNMRPFRASPSAPVIGSSAAAPLPFAPTLGSQSRQPQPASFRVSAPSARLTTPLAAPPPPLVLAANPASTNEERKVRYAGAEHTLGPTFSEEEDGDDSEWIAGRMAAVLNMGGAAGTYGASHASVSFVGLQGR
jgi:hypothetical protein